MKEAMEFVRLYLSVFDEQLRDEKTIKNIQDALVALKKIAVEQNEQLIAKEIWCCEQILIIQNSYTKAFWLMKQGEYYSAWCLLERVEIALHHLEPHFVDDGRDYKLWFISKHVPQFQSLFPYRLFVSPGFIKKKILCSICQQPISLRKPCGHVVGEIYNGEMCGREITEVQFLELSVTPEPAQKYSVFFVYNEEKGEHADHYNYSVVKYVIDGLRQPFDGWDVTRTKIFHPHSRYANVKLNNPCPCDSNQPYSDCCALKEGVLRPHIDIHFWIDPPSTLPAFMYSE